MRVVVVGAGVIGVTSAWYLSRAGHEVTVIERHEASALGTSFANAAQISPALSSPWAFPGLLRKVAGWMLTKYPPLRFGKVPDPTLAGWMWQMLRAANEERYLASKRRMVELAEYSRDCLAALRSEFAIDYAGRQRGILVLFREEAQRIGYAKDLKILDQLKVPYRVLGPDGVRGCEPNIDRNATVVGGVLLETDETGDCFRFTQALAALAAAHGVTFHYGHTAKRLATGGGRVTAIESTAGTFETDAVVIATGVHADDMLREHGIVLPIQPVKGYSLTITADSDAVGPVSSISDETYKVALTSLGDRIRIGGTAELAGFDLSRNERRYAVLKHSLASLFPKVPDAAIRSAERWSGLRPMTPDGPPIVGQRGFANLYVNAGHGTLGWTMACGSGRLLADLVSQQQPEIAWAA